MCCYLIGLYSQIKYLVLRLVLLAPSTEMKYCKSLNLKYQRHVLNLAMKHYGCDIKILQQDAEMQLQVANIQYLGI